MMNIAKYRKFKGRRAMTYPSIPSCIVPVREAECSKGNFVKIEPLIAKLKVIADLKVTIFAHPTMKFKYRDITCDITAIRKRSY